MTQQIKHLQYRLTKMLAKSNEDYNNVPEPFKDGTRAAGILTNINLINHAMNHLNQTANFLKNIV